MTRTQYDRAEAFMLESMQGATHDVLHVRRVLHYALLLCESSAADADVVAMAALLHDIGRPEQDADPGLDHAAIGAEKARGFLLGEGWGEGFADQVAGCILRHRSGKKRPPDTLEAQILYDADKLDLSGAMGVARTLLFGGEIGEPLYLLDENGQPLPGGKAEGDSFLRECKRKLPALPGKLYTERARALAEERRAVAIRFGEALEAEIQAAHAPLTRQLATLFEEETP